MIDLRNEPEIFPHDRNKPQILDGHSDPENAQLAIGFASRCWTPEGVFDTAAALRVANELAPYMRLLREGRLVGDQVGDA